jgi:TRAP-type C4-dicarboxylate transport system permease small subunit
MRPPVASTPEKLDDVVYRLERLVVVASLAIMSVVVFLDVIHRTFASEENKFVGVLAKIIGLFGMQKPTLGSPEYQSLETAAPIVLWVVFVWLAYFGVRTATREVAVPPLRALAYAVVGVIGAYGLVRLMIAVMPNGFIWSQPLALVLTLWVGFFGASMCTHDNKHLRVEAVQRFLPESIRPLMGFVSGLLTTAVTFALAWLSLRYVMFNYDEYVATEGQGGLFIGLDVPKYWCFAALPLAFALMTVRFGARSIRALRGEVELVDPLKDLIDEEARVPVVAPSDIPTDVVGVPTRAKPTSLESDIPTEVVRVADDDGPGPGPLRRSNDADVLPSEIPTDPHRVIKSGLDSADDEEQQ